MNKYRSTSFLILMVLCNSCMQGSQSIPDLIEQAKELEAEKKYHLAVNSINKAIEMDMRNPSLYVFRGRLNSLMNQSALAIRDYNIATQLDESNTAAYFYKAREFSIMQKNDSALNNYQFAIKTKEVGDVFFDEKYNDYIDEYEQTDIPMHVIRYYRGTLLILMDKNSEALNDFKFALANKYEIIDCKYFIGTILLEEGKNSEGCQYLKEASKAGDVDAQATYKKYCN